MSKKFDSFKLLFDSVEFNAEDMGYMKGWVIIFKYQNGVTGEYLTPKNWSRSRVCQFLVNMVETDGARCPTVTHLLSKQRCVSIGEVIGE